MTSNGTLRLSAGTAGAQRLPEVGYTGPRDLDEQWRALAVATVEAVLRADAPRQIVVGDCPTGLDAWVREAAGDAARVFKASDPDPLLAERRALQAQRLARRSARMVESVVAAPAGGSSLLGFVHDPCPGGLVPYHESWFCWSGWRNGTWSTLAYAIGLSDHQRRGLPVLVAWCADGDPQLPVWPGVVWEIVGGVGVWSAFYRARRTLTAQVWQARGLRQPQTGAPPVTPLH